MEYNCKCIESFKILVDDIILDLFTFKIKCNEVPNHQESMNYVTSLHSKRLNTIVGAHFQSSPNESCILILLTLWSDGFDPNGLKKNKNKIWLYTLTLNIIGKKYTYPIGLCKKEIDFNEIHSKLICNMKDWVSKRRKVFCYGTRSVQEIFIIPFVFPNSLFI